MTITRALVELKHLEDRIERKSASKFIGVHQDRSETVQGTNETRDQFSKRVKEDLQAVTDLIKRRFEIKRKIMASNAKTKVEIAGKKYTVAEAIDRRQNLHLEEGLLKQLRGQYTQCIGLVEESAQRLEEQTAVMLEKNLGVSKKTSPEDYKNIAEPFIKANEFKVFDPGNIKDKISKIEEDIDSFKKDVDFALSEVNAQTEI